MGFNYENVIFHNVKDGNKYFLDSNIWLKILQPKIDSTAKEKQYALLFEKIRSNTKVKIMLPALVVSEVVNRILREVHMQKYIKKKGLDKESLGKDFYKNVYRPTEEFRIAYNLICDEIKNYHESIVLINDDFGGAFKFKHVLSNPPHNLDFNDHYYYNLCKKNNFILVTDDKDFWVEEVVVLTYNSTLIDKKNAHTMELANKKPD